MVKCIIRHIYICEVCGEEYERYSEAKNCEEIDNKFLELQQTKKVTE